MIRRPAPGGREDPGSGLSSEAAGNKLAEYRDFFIAQFLPGVFPKGSRAVGFEYFDNYNLPCPIRVEIESPDGSIEWAVLRVSRNGDPLHEARVLKILLEAGLAVPAVLTENEEKNLTLLELLPGKNLQEFATSSSVNLARSKQLLIEAINQAAAITAAVEPKLKFLPKKELVSQLGEVKEQNRWAAEEIFQSACAKLEPALKGIHTPLVFTNGDYQPANFLTDGESITGHLDFECACFQDPLMGFVKFPIYDLRPLNGAGFVGDFLAASNMSQQEFAPRLALGCLMTLKSEIPVEGGDEDMKAYRNRVLGLLNESLKLLPT